MQSLPQTFEKPLFSLLYIVFSSFCNTFRLSGGAKEMIQKEEVTIKDLARELGISPSTVSRALKDHPDISPDTKKAVNELAKKLNYRPNPIALSLKGGSSRIIGVIVPEIVHFFFSTILSGVDDFADEAGYNVIICQSNEIYENEVKNVDALISSRADGIMISLAKTTSDYLAFEKDYR